MKSWAKLGPDQASANYPLDTRNRAAAAKLVTALPWTLTIQFSNIYIDKQQYSQ